MNVRRYHDLKRRSKRALIFVISLAVVCVFGIVGYAFVKEREVSEQKTRVTELSAAADKAIAGLENRKNAPVYITLGSAAPIRALVENYNDPASLWAFVNKQRTIPLDYTPSVTVPNVATRPEKGIEEQSVRRDIVKPLEALFAATRSEGHDLMIGSGYRSSKLQSIYFNSYAASSGIEQAKQYSAEPGHSEHQLGLAVDISSTSRQCYLSECFTNTADGEWLAQHAHEYGFHLHYQKGKEPVTGYNFEPWHYRYVGVDLATALYKSGLTFDEAWPKLEAALAQLQKNGALLQN